MPVNNNKDLELPSGWVRVPLEDVVYIAKEKFSPSPGIIVPYLGLEHIEKDTGKILGRGNSSEVSSTKTLFSSGDLLYGRLRPYLCKVAIPDFDGVCSTDIIVFKKHPCLSNQFLKYALMGTKFTEYSVAKTSGQHPRISTEDLLAYPVELPPFAEQNRIVTRLETLLEELDQMEVALQQAKIQSGEYRQALLRDAFEGDIIYEFAKGFEYYQLGDICELISGQHILNEDYDSSGKGTPYFTGPADFTETHPMVSKWTNKPKVISKKFDVLITVKGSGVGKSNLNNEKQAAIGRQLMAVRSEFYDPWFLFHFFKYKFQDLQAKSTGSAIPGIDRSTLLTLKIPNISLKAQKQILSVLDEKLKSIQETEKDIDSNLSHTQSLRQSLFQDAFTGQLVPQNPNDEPAIQLLKRIKTEKIRMAEEQKQRDKANREASKARAQELEVHKTIMQVLEENGGIYPAVSVWRESEHKDDIEKFYAELKDLMEKQKTVTEDPEKQNLLLVP